MTTELEEQLPHVNKRIKPKRSRKKLAVYIVASVAAVLTISLVAFNLQSATTGGQSLQNNLAKSSVDFPVFYPEKLPKNYIVDDKTIHLDPSLVSYAIRKGDQSLTVSQQPYDGKPLAVELPKTKELQVAAGSAVISRFANGQLTVLVRSNQSLISISSTMTISDQELLVILESLKRIE